MSRFETPIKNPSHLNRLNGLSLQAIDIAENPSWQRNINDFMTVAADAKSVTAGGHEFNHRRISALGSLGTLVSVYLQQSPNRSLAIEHAHVAMMASLEDPIVNAWSTTSLPSEYGASNTEIVIGELGDDNHLKSVDLSLTPAELEEENLRELIELERDWQNFPRIRFGRDAWQLQEGGATETLSDLAWVKDRVRLAITRGFGKAVVQRFDPEYYESQRHSGQKDEKVVA
ncbi:MAG: hypothetical protein V4678_01520 [Patescibacteria group bacterium]